ncbi:hypothetical protein PYCC9005_004691 [Savitreella phatthalungensis]
MSETVPSVAQTVDLPQSDIPSDLNKTIATSQELVDRLITPAVVSTDEHANEEHPSQESPSETVESPARVTEDTDDVSGQPADKSTVNEDTQTQEEQAPDLPVKLTRLSGWIEVRKGRSALEFSQRRFFYTDESCSGVPLDNLQPFYVKHVESSASAPAVDKNELYELIAHASVSGRGLLFYCRDSSRRGVPSGIIDLTTVSSIYTDTVKPLGIAQRLNLTFPGLHGWALRPTSANLSVSEWRAGLEALKKDAIAKKTEIRNSQKFKEILQLLRDGKAFRSKANPADVDDVLSGDEENIGAHAGSTSEAEIIAEGQQSPQTKEKRRSIGQSLSLVLDRFKHRDGAESPILGEKELPTPGRAAVDKPLPEVNATPVSPTGSPAPKEANESSEAKQAIHDSTEQVLTPSKERDSLFGRFLSKRATLHHNGAAGTKKTEDPLDDKTGEQKIDLAGEAETTVDKAGTGEPAAGGEPSRSRVSPPGGGLSRKLTSFLSRRASHNRSVSQPVGTPQKSHDQPQKDDQGAGRASPAAREATEGDNTEAPKIPAVETLVPEDTTVSVAASPEAQANVAPAILATNSATVRHVETEAAAEVKEPSPIDKTAVTVDQSTFKAVKEVDNRATSQDAAEAKTLAASTSTEQAA